MLLLSRLNDSFGPRHVVSLRVMPELPRCLTVNRERFGRGQMIGG